MRYLKTYESFGSLSDIKSDIDDILLDITDAGYEIQFGKAELVTGPDGRNDNCLHYLIVPDLNKTNIPMDMQMVIPVLSRVVELSKEEGLKVYFDLDVSDGFVGNATDISGYLDKEVYYISMDIIPEEVKESVDYNDAIGDIEDLLFEISDKDGYHTSVTEADHYILIDIRNDNRIDLDEISDDLIHLYDYMKEHQHLFKRRPDTARIRAMSGILKIIGWGQPDKRHKDAYARLRDNEWGMTELQFRWNKAKPVTESNYSDVADEQAEDARDHFYDLMDDGFTIHPSRGSVIDDGENKFVIHSLQITKSEGDSRRGPFMFSDIIDSVDNFMEYVGDIVSDKEKPYVKVSFWNYSEHEGFEKDYGRFHNWEDLKQRIRWYAGLPSLVNRVQIYYRVDLEDVNENYGSRDKTDMYIRDGQWTLLDDGWAYKNIRNVFGISEDDLGDILSDFMEEADMNYQVGSHRINNEEIINVNLYPNTKPKASRYNWKPDGYDIAYFDWVNQKLPDWKKAGSASYDILQTMEDRLNDKGLTITHTDNRSKDFALYLNRESASLFIKKKKKEKKGLKNLLKFWESKSKRGDISDITENLKDIFIEKKQDEKYYIKVTPSEAKGRKKISEFEYSDLMYFDWVNISIDVQKHVFIEQGNGYWTDDDFDVKEVLEELRRVEDYLKGLGAPWVKFRAKMTREDDIYLDWEDFEREIESRDDFIVESIWIYCKIDLED